MNHNSAPNPSDDDIFLDVELTDKNSAEIDFSPSEQLSSSVPLADKNQQSKSLRKPFSWLNITKQRLNIVKKRQENQGQEPENKTSSLNLEQIKTKTMAIAITLGMLPLLVSSSAVYYFGNQAIKKEEIYSKEGNSQLLKEHLESQKRTLFFLLTGTEVTAVLVGILSALWSQRTVNMVARVASQKTSLAIKAAKEKKSQLLAKIVLSIRQSIDSEDIMANAVRETRTVLQCDRVIIYQFESQGNGQVLAESADPKFGEILLTYTEDLGLESKYLSEYQKKHCKIINNIYQESQLDSEHLSQYESLEIKSCLHAPLEQQGEVIGLVIAYQCSDFRPWKSEEIALLNQIAVEIGLALDDAQLVTDCLNLQIKLKERTLWQKCLSDSLEYIHSSTKATEIIEIAAREVRRVLKCDRAVVCRVNPSNQTTIIAESVAAEYPKILGTVLEEPCFTTESYQESLQIIHALEEAKISSSYRKQLENLAVKSLLFAPIIHQKKLYGFLIAHQCSVQRLWQEFESKWFKQIAKQLGYSLDNARSLAQTQDSVHLAQSEKQAVLHSQLPVFLEESKISLENFSQKVLAEVDAVTPIFKQMQVMAQSVEGLTNNINQTKLQTKQVDGILRLEHKNVDLTEDRLIDIQQSLRQIAVKNINLGQSCQQFRQTTGQINKLVKEITEQIDKTNVEFHRIGIVSEKSLQELTQTVYALTERLATNAETIELCFEKIKAETEQITDSLEKSEAKAFVGIEIAQETRQNLNQITIRNQEINQLIDRITVAASLGEQNSQLAQQSLLEVANLANQAAKKSVAAVQTIASLTEFLEKL